MRVGLRTGERHFVFDVQRDGPCYRVHDGSVDHQVRAEIVDAESLLIEIDGTRHHVTFVQNGDTFCLAIAGESYVLSRQQLTAAGRHVDPISSPDILAPMPGKVIQVLVQPGNSVAGGDPLLILEAMKMETRLLAEGPGIIEAVNVNPGDLVEGGQVLAVIKYT